jgi:uncharacterized membrane protein (DUF373 family)
MSKVHIECIDPVSKGAVMDNFVSKIPKLFERVIVISLIIMMMVVILLSTYELGHLLVVDIFRAPSFLLEISDLLDVFGFFLLILIGVELLETIRAYLNDHVVHVEIVLEVALIAVARKIVVVDPKEYTPETLLSIAAIVLALAVAYFLQKQSHQQHPSKSKRELLEE